MPDDSAGAPTPRLRVETLGCRLNAYESEAMRKLAAEAGAEGAVVINTCAVTNEAVRQARQTIRKLRAEQPDARIIVTGCAAQIDPASFAAMPEVDLVLGNQEKMAPESWARIAAEASGPAAEAEIRVDDIMSARETASHLLDGFGARARAFVQIQNGCDHRCTFCIIPFGRGPSRSAAAGVVVDQIRRLVGQGYREVVLTGVDITSWGADLPALGGRAPMLGDLVQRIFKLVPDLPRLRISSIDSVEIDPALYEAIEEPRLAPHLHLSLQAGDDLILKRMKRRHLSGDAERVCAEIRARRPDIVFGADLIAGFPTETEEMFDRTLAHVEACGLTYLHVFPFSARPGTPAARMPQQPRAVAKERAARLRALGDRRLDAYLQSEVGAERRVLIEAPRRGRTEGYAEVTFEQDQPVGDIISARIFSVAQKRLQAQAV
ncbi:MAG: tRNA (N(6)-L-threonylcarbamoyladenosine(37)-C(2))-methylthiotransferase MtaB [Neomegalonema sp.]|nr:tRNA (N(6)-L-threonylcarbamoyladenosine(37)-C(2))-methylthiotransferase MtaB [Neomegalonema sp.]